MAKARAKDVKKNARRSNASTGVSTAKRWALAPDVFIREGNDGLVHVMNLTNTSDYFTIDKIAAEIVALIDGRRSWKSILDKIARRHAMFDRDELDAKAAKLVHQLAKLKIVE